MATSSLKWAGNKHFVAKHIERLLKNEFVDLENLRVMEPFIGSAGLSLYYEFKNVIANDLYPPLIHYYETIRNEGIGLYELKSDKSTYLKIREHFNQKVQNHEYDKELADQLLYLNRTGFNGLMRTNLKGEINTPCGDFNEFPEWVIDVANNHKPIIDTWEFHTGCFTVLPRTKPIDFLYLDPPYAGKKMFTTYAGRKFTAEMQDKVIEFAEGFPSTTRVMISNSTFDYELLKKYKRAGYKLYVIKVPRTISAKVSSRKPVDEVIAIKNFQTKRVATLCERLSYLKI
ncbi:Dam family site-specific DNA-(adenine-N6)-methyltransferase [Vibrio parahaemolyticus]|uniref:site-specific DNA-methyltransferase (adenine-specific) n=1 Tax=Vibrio parahaemolyticus TaxID=670 RepID=A0A9Q3YG13_VIBPH|nr:Dam family site-specific DNA-(adenine-N6)-methyltransferase [Vibrio parahaemolyticus]MCC3803816.1 Dam family site-specific DNA-(adenine-N6)-methyltransferase [Vibrio parahaemolyticus]